MTAAAKRLARIRKNHEWKRYLRVALRMFNEDPFPSVKWYKFSWVPDAEVSNAVIHRADVKDDLRQQFDRQYAYEQTRRAIDNTKD